MKSDNVEVVCTRVHPNCACLCVERIQLEIVLTLKPLGVHLGHHKRVTVATWRCSRSATQDGDAPPADEEPEVVEKKSASSILSPTCVKVRVKTVAEDERYSKFFKMLKMGVPLQVLSTLLKYFIFEPLFNHNKIMEN